MSFFRKVTHHPKTPKQFVNLFDYHSNCTLLPTDFAMLEHLFSRAMNLPVEIGQFQLLPENRPEGKLEIISIEQRKDTANSQYAIGIVKVKDSKNIIWKFNISIFRDQLYL